MNPTQARVTLERKVAASSVPVLSSAEITDLLSAYQVVDMYGVMPAIAWQPSTLFFAGDIVVPSTRNGHQYRIATGGTSGDTEPIWPTADGATVADGTLTWAEYGTDNWVNTYDFDAAAAEGWRWKAAKVADNVNFSADGLTMSASQLFDHCMEQARFYASKGGIRSVSMGGSYDYDSDVAVNTNAGD